MWTLLFTSLLTSNVVLTKFLGLCPFFGVSTDHKKATIMGLLVTIVVTISSILSYLLYHYILIPSDSEYLKTIVFILVIASLVQCTEILMKKFNKALYKSLGIYLPLITTNCAVLGIVLLNISNGYNLLETIVFGLGSSLGFMMVIYVFSTIREYLDTRDIPKCFKGYPIAFIVAFVMALLFGRLG